MRRKTKFRTNQVVAFVPGQYIQTDVTQYRRIREVKVRADGEHYYEFVGGGSGVESRIRRLTYEEIHGKRERGDT